MSDRFRGQKALFINCSIKRNKAESHTQKLLDKAVAVMQAEGVDVEQIYALEHTIATGMVKDASDEGVADVKHPGETDELRKALRLADGSNDSNPKVQGRSDPKTTYGKKRSTG